MRTNARGAIFAVSLVLLALGAMLVVYATSGSSPVYVVVSGSMAPTLDVGDLVLVRSVPFGSIHVGDVIVFARPSAGGACSEEVIIHRVVGIATNGGLITQGDDRLTNPLPDEPTEWSYVQASCVKGEAALSLPYIGFISTSFPPPYSFVLVASIAVLIFLVGFVGGRREANESNTTTPAVVVGLVVVTDRA